MDALQHPASHCPVDCGGGWLIKEYGKPVHAMQTPDAIKVLYLMLSVLLGFDQCAHVSWAMAAHCAAEGACCQVP